MRQLSTRGPYRSANSVTSMCPASQAAAATARASRAARTLSPASSRRFKSRTALITWVESVRCLPPAATRPASLQCSRSRSKTTRSIPLSASRARNLDSTLASKPVSVRSAPSPYFQSIARTAIAAACRSVRSSANCNTVTSDNAPGDRPGAPRTPNASVNGSSVKTSARRSRTVSPDSPSGTPPGPPSRSVPGSPAAPPGASTSVPPPGPHDRKATQPTIIADPALPPQRIAQQSPPAHQSLLRQRRSPRPDGCGGRTDQGPARFCGCSVSPLADLLVPTIQPSPRSRVRVSVRALVFPDTRRVTCTYTPWHGFHNDVTSSSGATRHRRRGTSDRRRHDDVPVRPGARRGRAHAA